MGARCVNTEEVRQRLLARREELRARETGANAGLRQQPDLSSSDYGDESNQSEQNGLLSALSRAADAELKRVESALQRLNAGRYTTCVICGEEIEPPRLAALPHTDRCITCAERSLNA
jgi:RNA polymerase-binding transcription factor DksA